MKKKLLNNNTGSALIWAVLLMMLLSVFALGAAFLVQFNNKQSARSVDLIQSRYVAKAGIELAYTTLISQYPGSNQMVIEALVNNQLPLTHSEEITVNGHVLGHFDAEIKLDDDDPAHWLVVTSVGVLNYSDVTVERVLKINKKNIEDLQHYENIR